MVESKSFRLVRLYQIVQSVDNQIKYPSIIAKKLVTKTKIRNLSNLENWLLSFWKYLANNAFVSPPDMIFTPLP